MQIVQRKNRSALFRIPLARPFSRLGILSLKSILSLYRILLSPLLGQTCRFYPSCSVYALGAIEKYGACKGTGLAVMRLAKCHPFHPGGFDPVR